MSNHDHKGFSEEKCVRCGWVMGHPPLNCNNDDTPHQFPSQHEPIVVVPGFTDPPPAKQRIAINQRNIASLGVMGFKDSEVGVCDLCMALIWPGEDAARKHVEWHGGELESAIDKSWREGNDNPLD